MYSRTLGQLCSKQLHNGSFTEKEEFPNGKLPVEKDVIEVMIYMLRPDRAGRLHISIKEATSTLCYVLIDHWNFGQIRGDYPIAARSTVVPIVR